VVSQRNSCSLGCLVLHSGVLLCMSAPNERVVNVNVVLCTWQAVGVSSFLSMIGLVSGLSLIATALVFPPMCYWQRFSQQAGVAMKALLLVLIIVGSIGAVFTTYLAAKKVSF